MNRGSHRRGSDGRVLRACGAATASRAFTLVELLVVIGIIAILISLTLAVGAKVTASGKTRMTENVLKILETASANFETTQSHMIPGAVQYLKAGGDPKVPSDWLMQPIADGRIGAGPELINSVGWFMYQCKSIPEVAPTFQKLDPRLVKLYTPGSQLEIPTAFDGWGNPIRYVNPAFDGLIHGPDYLNGIVKLGGIANAVDLDIPVDKNDINAKNPFDLRGYKSEYVITSVRRNNAVLTDGEEPDSDGGVCVGNKPYFYSAGPDGKVGYLVDNAGKVLEDYNADNVYLTQPQIEKVLP